MKKELIIVILILSSFHFKGIGQDNDWKKINIDENLSLSLPGKLSQTDTLINKDNKKMRFRIFKAETEFSTLGITITPNETNLNVDNKESLKIALNGIAKGTCESANDKGFSCESKDTIISNLPCKKFIISAGNSLVNQSLNSYTFLINDKMYMFTITASNKIEDAVSLANESKKFLNYIRFTSNITEQKFDSKAESMGYKIGYYIIPLLLFIGIIVYVVRK